ncbi:MAG: hypothetical protein JW891_18710 [Candidatus Lokiarchaeota archaeon]|nr:hypothetical protein [Candidatus Lokiarchaeota archaeon]
MKDEVNKAYSVFKEAFEVLSEYFDEKRSDTVVEKKDKIKISLAKFSKGLIGNTDKINFRILIGQKKEPGDFIYEAVYLNDKKDPRIFIYDVEKGKPINTVLSDFKEEDWNGYKKLEKFKDIKKFLEYAYQEGVYSEGKKEKKEDALNKLIKGLKRSLEAIEADEKERGKVSNDRVKKIAKIIAITAVTTIATAMLTPAVGVIAQEIATGGQLTGGVAQQAGQAALEGLKNVADPLKLAKKAVTKSVTKGVDIGGNQ